MIKEQMEHLEKDGTELPTATGFYWIPENSNPKYRNPNWDYRRIAGEEFYRRYGRTIPDKKVIEKILSLDKTLIDVTGESGIFARACSKFPPIDIAAADFGLEAYPKKFFPVTKLDMGASISGQLPVAPRSVFMGDPFDQPLIPMDRWLEILDWIPQEKFLFYSGIARNWEQKSIVGATGIQIIREGPQRFNNKLASEFTQTFSRGPVPGWHPNLPSIFEVWQKE